MATTVFRPITSLDYGETIHLNKYYLSPAGGGYNLCRVRNTWSTSPNTTYQRAHGLKDMYPYCVVPNCTGFAYGRFMECLGVTKCNLSTSDAGKWYYHTSDGYTRSKTPKLGAVICWSGHVAVVEAIHENGEITWSESGFSQLPYFGMVTGNPADKYGGFQGYIHPPVEWTGIEGSAYGASQPKYVLANMNFVVGSGNTGNEKSKQNNAIIVYLYLKEKGFSDNPIYAVLGNMELESQLDPTLSYTVGKNDAYGLLQWDPHTKWTNWARTHGKDKTDGFGQLEFFIDTHSSEWYKKDEYQLSWDEFINDTTHSLDWLTRAFCEEYERAGIPHMDKRITYANKWKSFFESHAGDFGNITGLNYTTGYSGSMSLTGDFDYTKPNNKHLILTGGWI